MWARLPGDVIKDWIHKDKDRAFNHTDRDKDQTYKNKDLKLIFIYVTV